ncbi:MAG TPA: hypothetical protein VF834_19535 [Streptosporangiaceae bacterium]
MQRQRHPGWRPRKCKVQAGNLGGVQVISDAHVLAGSARIRRDEDVYESLRLLTGTMAGHSGGNVG